MADMVDSVTLAMVYMEQDMADTEDTVMDLDMDLSIDLLFLIQLFLH
jgi:hypothetical protein